MAVYVMSDIHGDKARFDQMLATIQLQKDDKVYFLGDVIDRGKEGIAILEHIMNDERFTLFMGNHEWMMLKCLQEPSAANFNLWFANGGHVSHFKYLKLSGDRQAAIKEYLKNLPLALCDLVVNGRCFYLTHAYADTRYLQGYVYLQQVKEPYSFLWERNINYLPRLADRTIIAGHTITALLKDSYDDYLTIYHDGHDLHDANYINIDCGCASKSKYARFACLRLDDMHVFYV
ncbi:MAG: metallophosphoesterase [Erysipelotrichaceae bacterium]|nr:metallophosphoesterase [Erysipelotrichaceae bacterium]